MNKGIRLTHVGLCVRDIAYSTEFYCAALGFEKVGEMHVSDSATARLLDVTGLVLDLVYLQRDGFRLELLGYAEPGTTGRAEPRAMNALGFTHLSFRVDDVDAVTGDVVQHGGHLLADRSVAFDGGNRGVMLTDPDGNLLELIERVQRMTGD
ncbi:VOC family protein [Mycolicibacterium iranicum]|uniref:Lactoylglutathione lyase n=1 Tax=Mycolicibacterium iranicum TaxID=912594 RepID=A0A1X1WHW2_MYCIR|nr:VOC family protein [Mycolicibacterium iranicum]ORV86197.1 lactoylglutathione lyase [Mycolicibacterium iranicum]